MLYEKWFARRPAADDLAVVITPATACRACRATIRRRTTCIAAVDACDRLRQGHPQALRHPPYPKGVDLDVAERELVFVIGPSGSGKPDLHALLNRLEEPSAGSITVDGIDTLSPRTDINHARQRIGMVFQSFNLYPHMTALGNVTLALRKVAGKSRAEADALGRAALERVGLADRGHHRPAEPSAPAAAWRSPGDLLEPR